MLKANLCNYSNVYIRVKQTITIRNTGTAAATSIRNMKILFNNCSPFTGSISEIDHTQIDNVKNTDSVIPMYSFTKYSGIYFKTSGSLWQY